MRISVLILLCLISTQSLATNKSVNKSVNESGWGWLASTITLKDNYRNPVILTSEPHRTWDDGRKTAMKRLEDATDNDRVTMDDGDIKNIWGECLTLSQHGVPLWWDCGELTSHQEWWYWNEDRLLSYAIHWAADYVATPNCLRTTYSNNFNKWELLSYSCYRTDPREDEAFYFHQKEEPRGKRLINNGKCLEKMRGDRIKTAGTTTCNGFSCITTDSAYFRQYNPQLRTCSEHPDQFWAQLHLTSDFDDHVSDTVKGTSIIWNTSQGADPRVTPSHESQCLANDRLDKEGKTFQYAQLAPAKDNPLGECKSMMVLDGQIITAESYTLRESLNEDGIVFFTEHAHDQEWNLTEYQEFYIGGRCIAAAGNGTSNYTNIIPWKCNGHDSQKWAMGWDGLIHSKMKWDMCLDVLNYDPNDYASIHLYKCHGDYNQQFYWKDGRLLSRLNDKAVTFDGGEVVLLDPGAATEQEFKVYPSQGDE